MLPGDPWPKQRYRYPPSTSAPKVRRRVRGLVPLAILVVERRQDPNRQLCRTAAIGQFEQGMEVVPPIAGDLLGKLPAESAGSQAPDAPGRNARTPWSRIARLTENSHTSYASWTRPFLPAPNVAAPVRTQSERTPSKQNLCPLPVNGKAMSVTGLRAPALEPSSPQDALERVRSDPAYQAFWLLRIGFTVAPILFGADKFANVLVNWERYLAPWIRDASPLSATHTMYVVGVIEIVAGLAVAIKPRYAAYVVGL